MVTLASVSYHRWSARCFQVMALAETIMATVGTAEAQLPSLMERLEAETRKLLAESEQIGDSFDREELKRIAHDALDAADRLHSVIARTRLAQGEALHALADEFAAIAEEFTLAVDPATEADVRNAMEDARRGESTSWEELRRQTE